MRATLALAAALLAAGCLAPALEQTSVGPGAGAAGFTANAVTPGAYALEGDWARVLADGPLGVLEPQIEVLTSDLDGAAMPLAVIRPDVPEGVRVPVLVHATPYLFAPLTPEGVAQQFEYEARVENFVPHGYAVAFVPIRGTSNHGGCMDLMGPAERADLDQTITWLGEQPWSNGRVAIAGLSYDGSTPWEVAATGNPYLKTIVPISGLPDIYSLMVKNGTPEARVPIISALYYSYGFLQYNPVENGRSVPHVANGAICPESWKGILVSQQAAATNEPDPLGYWAARDSRPGILANYEGSVLLVHGLQDWNVDPSLVYPWIESLEAKGVVVKHLLGQWDHAFPDRTFGGKRDDIPEHPRMDWAQMQLRWYDRWLKDCTAVGADGFGGTTCSTDGDLGPRVEVQDSSGRWRMEEAWPPADSVATPLYLAPDGKLAAAADAPAGEVPLAGPRLWAPVAECVACAVFSSEAFADETRFAGVPTAHFKVTPFGPGGLTAALFVVDGGERTRVGWGGIDLAFADGGDRPRPVVPGQAIVARMVLEPLDVVVPAGAHLQLVVAQDDYSDRMVEPSAPAKLHVGGDASVLTLRTFARTDASAFFEPPMAE